MCIKNLVLGAIFGFSIGAIAAEMDWRTYDLNGDGVINIYDVSIIGSCFGRDLEEMPRCSIADLNGDGVINLADLEMLVVELGNEAPTADAGIDQWVETGDMVTLNGNGSTDPNSDSLSYSRSILSQPASGTAELSDATSVSPNFVADAAGAYVIQLIVDDGTF